MTESFVSRARARGPYKLTDDVVERICQRIADGAFIEHACAAECVSAMALRELRARDEAVEAAVRAALAAKVTNLLGAMQASNDWRREAWSLERTDREVFAPPKQTVDSTNKHTGAPSQVLVIGSVDDLKRIARGQATIEGEVSDGDDEG